MQTSLIKYNLKDRGRKYRGAERDYDIPALVKYINGPECQERVKNRDMLGYYGHWIRTRFGFLPQEGDKAPKGGRADIIEPAFVTVHLKVSNDGTIEHREEFLTTDSGKIAEKLNDNKVGGFSSVISAQSNMFYGFDYVLEPNYTTNRDYILDGVNSSQFTEAQWETAIRGEQLRGAIMLVDSVSVQNRLANETIEHLREENEELLAMLTRAGIKQDQIIRDSVLPIAISDKPRDRLQQDIDFFNAARELPQFDEPKPKQEDMNKIIPYYSQLLNRKS